MKKAVYQIQLWSNEGDIIIKSEDDYDITGKKMEVFLEPGEYRQGYLYPFLEVKKNLVFDENSKKFEMYMISDARIKNLADEVESQNFLELNYDTHDAEVRVISDFILDDSGEIIRYEY